MFTGEDKEARERDEIRQERHRDRQRDRNIARAAPEKRFVARWRYEDTLSKSVQ